MSVHFRAISRSGTTTSRNLVSFIYLFLPFKDECSLTICDWVHCLPYHILPPSVLLCPSPSRLLPFIELLLSLGSEKGTEIWVFGELWQNESFLTIFFSGEGSNFLMVKIITSQFSLTWL